MERFLLINGNEYPASFSGKMTDYEWDNRYTKSIHLEMTFEQAAALFVDGISWSIKEVYPPTEEGGEPEIKIYDNSDFQLAGPITDFRDGLLSAKMGKLTDLEAFIKDLYGNVNADMVSPDAPELLTESDLSPRAKAFYELFKRHMISIGAVRQAVMDGVITEDEYKAITGQDYNA